MAKLIRRQVKVVFLIHNVMPHEARAWDRWMARIALRQGQAFIVQAPHERERLSILIPGLLHVYDSPHPAYQPFSKRPLLKTEARQQLGLRTDQAVLLFFGIVRPYKGLGYLLEALAHVQPDVHLIVAGEFWEDITVYRKQIENLGLNDKVTLINRYIPNEEAHQLLTAADGLVAPYIGGTQSGAAGLAIGYGLPMIITEQVAAGLPDAFPTGRNAGAAPQLNGYTHVVPAADPQALAQAIQELLVRLPLLISTHPSTSGDWSRLVKVIEEIGLGR
jgi:glycosyltransferase involved in cell wall biosynthesis